jgi:hypothetical protein
MSQQSSKSPTGFPEYAVRREIISGYFHPPLPSSTFHDLVKKGTIIPVKKLRGFYRLNESLKRLGLREVPQPPSEKPSRSMEDIMRLAFTAIDPEVFPAPGWMLSENELKPRDKDHARLVADLHRDAIHALPSFQEKAAYAAGVLDAQAVMDAESCLQEDG